MIREVQAVRCALCPWTVIATWDEMVESLRDHHKARHCQDEADRTDQEFARKVARGEE